MTDLDRAHLDDADLWKRAQDGDPECFGALFDRHGEAVRAYCARRSGSIDDADDLVSIVFLEAWRRRADVELVDGVALPWLYGIARNTLRHRWRTAVRHRRALRRLPSGTVEPDLADDVADRVDVARRLARLHDDLARLPSHEQDVLVLCAWQGLDYAAAAVALGIPVGTVRSRLSRARARLRDVGAGPPGPPAVCVPGRPRVVEEPS